MTPPDRVLDVGEPSLDRRLSWVQRFCSSCSKATVRGAGAASRQPNSRAPGTKGAPTSPRGPVPPPFSPFGRAAQAAMSDYLETPHRIEALLLCHFLAMLVEAIIEREIRTSMKTQGLAGIPLYPELRNCPAPSAPRILEIFNDVKRHHLGSGDQIVQTFQPQLTPLQQQVLDLLHIPASIYS